MVLTGTKLLIEHHHATHVVANHLALGDEVAGVLFLFHLFVDEPGKEVGGGAVVPFLYHEQCFLCSRYD